MCIAIAKPRKRTIPVDFLRESYLSNPHGWGFSVSNGEELITAKGVGSFEEFLESYNAHVSPESPAIIHFRWATAGEQSVANCHPFLTEDRYGPEYAMIHNGTLAAPYGRFRSGCSDTRDFNHLVLSPLLLSLAGRVGDEDNYTDDGFTNPAFTEILSLAIGNGNKMAILSKRGNIVVANQHLGHWINGIWMSNYDYVPTPVKKTKVKKK